jgi:RsiW-degrading membrane proteinase PrsW (M82 family)
MVMVGVMMVVTMVVMMVVMMVIVVMVMNMMFNDNDGGGDYKARLEFYRGNCKNKMPWIIAATTAIFCHIV